MKNYWAAWMEFVAAEISAGGPDPQFTLLFEIPNTSISGVETVWLAGCYGAHHCIPSAWAIWDKFRVNDIVSDDKITVNKSTDISRKLYTWLSENWDYLPVRPEMRGHRIVEQRAKCLTDFAHYAIGGSWATGNYNVVWDDSIRKVKHYGRYMAIKYLEMLRRSGIREDIMMHDMRAEGAWSPRITLGYLFPEHAHIISDRNNNTPEAIKLAEQCALTAVRKTTANGVPLNFFQLQVLLCEFKEMLAGGFYPGAGHDEEMDYIKQSSLKFDNTPIYEARKRVFNEKYLGELNGWHGIRKEQYTIWKDKISSMITYD